MTLEQARQIFFINVEIRRLKEDTERMDIDRIYYRSPRLTGLPSGRSASDYEENRLDRAIKLQKRLWRKLEELQAAVDDFEDFLSGIGDAQTRVLLRLRCVNNLTWEEIGEELHMDRRTASRKFYAFFADCPQCP